MNPTRQESTSLAVVVLAGGRASRFGTDKLAAPLSGTTVLDALLDSLPSNAEVIVVGPERATNRAVIWTREDPPQGGPLAAIAAGVRLCDSAFVAIVAGDMPWAGPAVERLTRVATSSRAPVAAVAVDDVQIPNPLLAVYRRSDLTRVLTHSTSGPARALLSIPHHLVPITGRAARDIDEPSDLPAPPDSEATR